MIMTMEHKPHTLQKILIIAGPTASGKSDLAVQIAKERNGEVISADSRQVYHGLDIGTGKITAEEMQGVAHHCLDIAEPGTRFTVVDWLTFAQEAVREIANKGKLPIICGGTGLYINALLYGIDDNPKPNQEQRKELENKTTVELQDLLKAKAGQEYFETLNNSERNNRNRLIRKLELENFYDMKSEDGDGRKRQPLYDAEFIILSPDKETLRERIHTRLIKRVENGMIQEVEQLLASGVQQDWLLSLGLEYKYITLYLTGEMEKEEMVTTLETKINQYARRQKTWNKRYETNRAQ